MIKFKRGRKYYHIPSKRLVEFRYMGTSFAIVCEPGDSGGGMQSCWGVAPNKLIEVNSDQHKQLVHLNDLKENLVYVLDNFEKFADYDTTRSNHLMAITVSCHKGEMSFHYGGDPCHEEIEQVQKNRVRKAKKK